jgi:hypothetical protein
MRVPLLLGAIIALAGCNKPSSAPPADRQIGRWSVVPVSGNPPSDSSQQIAYFAWRIDTVTGSLEMCTFDPGGWKSAGVPGGVARPSLECAAPVAAPSN